MFIHPFIKLPPKIIVAVSGGVDSMVTLDFIKRVKQRQVTVLFINHGTEFSNIGEEFMREYCSKNNINLSVRRLRSQPRNSSTEDFWHNERNKIYEEEYVLNKVPIVLGHHLDDSVETWIFSSLHGNGYIIPPVRFPVIRPLLCTPKSNILKWAEKNNIQWLEDPSNKDISIPRNRIRHQMMQDVLTVNPGIRKVVKKKILESTGSRHFVVSFKEGPK